MKSNKLFEALSLSAFFLTFSFEALAGMVVPGPIIGATGPYGIGAAVVGYGGYKVYKYIKSKR